MTAAWWVAVRVSPFPSTLPRIGVMSWKSYLTDTMYVSPGTQSLITCRSVNSPSTPGPRQVVVGFRRLAPPDTRLLASFWTCHSTLPGSGHATFEESTHKGVRDPYSAPSLAAFWTAT